MLYFAYASNLDPTQMAERAPAHRVIGLAELKDHRLSFPLYSQRWGGGVSSVQLARIERLTRIGGQVKLLIQLGTGESVTVQMPKAELDQLGLEQGDRVLVDLKAAKVFVEDYAI